MGCVASKRRLRNWNPAPGRGAVRAVAIAEPERKPPGRKDTRQWCKGREGREHRPEIVFAPPPAFRPETARCCEWGTWRAMDVRWSCHHQLQCTACGKILPGRLPAASCPDWPGSEEQKAEATARARESAQRVAAWRAQRRKPTVTGPQHYRRKRAS